MIGNDKKGRGQITRPENWEMVHGAQPRPSDDKGGDRSAQTPQGARAQVNRGSRITERFVSDSVGQSDHHAETPGQGGGQAETGRCDAGDARKTTERAAPQGRR